MWLREWERENRYSKQGLKPVSKENFSRVEVDNLTDMQCTLVHTDLAGPRKPVDINTHIYAIIFTDDFSSAVFVYFWNDTVSATKKFVTDSATSGRIRSLRYDNRSEWFPEITLW